MQELYAKPCKDFNPMLIPLIRYFVEYDKNAVGFEGAGYLWPESDDEEDDEDLPKSTLRGIITFDTFVIESCILHCAKAA